ncbi:MAG: hypothetical protein JNK61_09895 [Bacteroidia bacterium]|nr:hypothetical protein [Bacteroidia bacterium]
MKKHLLILLFVFAGFKSFAQNPTSDTTLQQAIYNKAILFGDYIVAKQALFNLMAQKPDRVDYIDSLARIYFGLGAYPQSLLASKIVLEKDPKNLLMLELGAVSQDALGNKKESLEMYEKLYSQTKSLKHGYQMAVLQFGLQRYGECNTTCDALLTNNKVTTEKISINVDQSNTQEVPLSAAIHNLKGVMYKEMNQNDKAKGEFEIALKEDATFVLATKNLEAISTKAESPKEDKKKK